MYKNSYNKNKTLVVNDHMRACYVSNTEYLAIVENDDCGVLQVMSFNTERELNDFASKTEDGFNHVTKYKATKIP
mgnify:CR=1 FL=1